MIRHFGFVPIVAHEKLLFSAGDDPIIRENEFCLRGGARAERRTRSGEGDHGALAVWWKAWGRTRRRCRPVSRRIKLLTRIHGRPLATVNNRLEPFGTLYNRLQPLGFILLNGINSYRGVLYGTRQATVCPPTPVFSALARVLWWRSLSRTTTATPLFAPRSGVATMSGHRFALVLTTPVPSATRAPSSGGR